MNTPVCCICGVAPTVLPLYRTEPLGVVTGWACYEHLCKEARSRVDKETKILVGALIYAMD